MEQKYEIVNASAAYKQGYDKLKDDTKSKLSALSQILIGLEKNKE